MTAEELLELLYKEIKPKTFKEFWNGLSNYKVMYPSLKDVTLKQVEVAFLQSREF